MTDGKAQAGVIGKLLPLQLPKPQPRPVAPPAVGSDQDRCRIRINPPPFNMPPPSNRGDGKFSGVMVSSHIDKASVAFEVVNAIRVGAWNFGPGKS